MKIGIAGFGATGSRVGEALEAGMDGAILEAVATGDSGKARHALREYRRLIPIVSPQELADRCDVIIECAPSAAFLEIIQPALRAGRTVITVSAAALIENMTVVDLARYHGSRIVLATGAILGLDAVRAAAEGNIYSVTIATKKPPRSLVGAPYLVKQGIDVSALIEPLLVFEGTAREGAAGFPANVNVAASLALAGIGPDKTRLQIWADPTRVRNTHTIQVDSDSARFEMTIENVPAPDNPGTSKIAALSVIAALRSLSSPLRVGT